MRFVLLALALLAIVSFCFAASTATMQLPTEYCLDTNRFAKDLNSEQVRACIQNSFPRSESICISLPSEYFDLRDSCLSKGLYCSSIIDPTLKLACDARLENRKNNELFAMAGFLVYLLIPVFGLGVLLMAALNLFKRKLSPKRILLYLVILAVFFIAEMFLIGVFCFPPCMIFY
ncbi:MAG: hypothetical protein AABW59_05245 [archaeon]